MKADDYVELASFPGPASAQAAKALLESDGIDCLLDPSDPFASAIASGISGVTLLVASTQRHRAELLLRESELSESELRFLATGAPPESEQG